MSKKICIVSLFLLVSTMLGIVILDLEVYSDKIIASGVLETVKGKSIVLHIDPQRDTMFWIALSDLSGHESDKLLESLSVSVESENAVFVRQRNGPGSPEMRFVGYIDTLSEEQTDTIKLLINMMQSFDAPSSIRVDITGGAGEAIWRSLYQGVMRPYACGAAVLFGSLGLASAFSWFFRGPARKLPEFPVQEP